MRRRQFYVPAGACDEDGVAAQLAHQVGQQFATAAVGPLQVVEDDQQGRAFANGVEQRAGGFPQAQLLLFGRDG